AEASQPDGRTLLAGCELLLEEMKDILESLPVLAANWHALGLSATGPLEEMYALVQERAALAAETLRLAAVLRELEGQETPAIGPPPAQRRGGRMDDCMDFSGIVLPPLRWYLTDGSVVGCCTVPHRANRARERWVLVVRSG